VSQAFQQCKTNTKKAKDMTNLFFISATMANHSKMLKKENALLQLGRWWSWSSATVTPAAPHPPASGEQVGAA
jgi:hypothetical protein